jgi:hypothetical protein
MEKEDEKNTENETEKYDFYKYGQNFGVQFQTGEIKYYDIIIDIDSLTKLFKKGWDILYTEKGDKNYESKKVNNLTVVAVIGNKNKGKSYILQKISGNKLPLGYSVTTKGISILYPKNLNQNIILLDSAGFEVPLLEIPGVYEFEITKEEEKKKFEEDLKNLNDEIKQATINKDKDTIEQKIKEKNELLLQKKNKISFTDKGDQIAKFTKDRRLTDYFLQKFILWNSDILLCVVGQLTFSDQKFINTIRSQINVRKKKKLFIIHNLTTFVEKKQVEDYIENTLMKSYTFELEKIQIPKFGEKNENENQYYWREKNLNKNDNNNGIDIIHLIMANDDENSEAGLYYNDSTIEYIKKQIMAYVDYTKFDIKKLLKNFLIEISKEILEKQLEEEDINIEGNKIIVKNKEFQLKNCLMDELGTNTFVDVNYKPKHRRYKTTINGENRYVIEVEIPGGVEDFKQTLDNKVGNNIITIKGKKKNIKITNKKEKKEKNEDNKNKEKKENANEKEDKKVKKKNKNEDDNNNEKKEDNNNNEKKENSNKIEKKVKKENVKKGDKKETKKNKKDTENEIELKPFELDIKIPLDVVQLDKFLTAEKENGIYKLIYSIITNDSDSGTVSLNNEDDEESDDGNDGNDDDDEDDNNNKKDDDDNSDEENNGSDGSD